MSLTCALSGEPLATTKEDVVVTPSGNVCIKRLLLQKLTENGGMDPFEQIREVPLNEDQLIKLSKATAGSAIPPPRPQSTSLPNLLQTIQTEYDSLILELFDTRKALEETRKELSQALYQNDAAVRVVARLAQERDAARQELERWNASVGGGGSAAAVETAEAGVEPPPPPVEEEEDEGTGEPQSKKRRVESLELPLKNDVPVDDLNIMVETNGELMAKRKPALKAAAAAAPSPEELAGYTEIENKAWHKSTCRSIHCLASSGGTNNNFIATAGKDNQIVIYDSVEKVAKYTFKHAGVTRVDVNDQMVVAGDAKGKIVAYSLGSGEMIGEFSTDKGAIVGISIHQSQKHIVAATSEGNLIIASVTSDGKLEQISYFEGDEDEKYTSGTIHPDGLIYAVGTKTGKLCLWDIKNKKLAATMVDGDTEDPIITVTASNNGYHLASSHESGAVRFWDIKKGKMMALMNGEKELFDGCVTQVVYDEGGKYVALGGPTGIKITTVKEWGTTASLDFPVGKGGDVSGLAWIGKDLIASSNKKRQVYFFGGKQEE